MIFSPLQELQEAKVAPKCQREGCTMKQCFPMNPYGQVWLVYGEISPMDPYGQVFPNESLWAG